MPGQILLDSRSLDRGYFRAAELERMIREHQEGTVDHSTRIWTLIQLELWHREIVEGARVSVEASVTAA